MMRLARCRAQVPDRPRPREMSPMQPPPSSILPPGPGCFYPARTQGESQPVITSDWAPLSIREAPRTKHSEPKCPLPEVKSV